eukprot:scaffold9178_cov176-Amphora_coffeaeformis.AAC.14
MKIHIPDDGQESNLAAEQQPLFPRNEGCGDTDPKQEAPLIDWLDVEQANCLITGEGKNHSAWRPSSPITSALESMTSSICCSCAWLARKRSSKSISTKKKVQEILVKIIKNVVSLSLLGFSIYMVMAAILTKQTKVAGAAGAPAAAVAMWTLILWLGLMEGGQGSLVGLQPVDKALYQQSHPIAYQCARLAHHGENFFIVNTCSSPLPGTSIQGVPDYLVEAFLESGLATIIITVILGQLAAEVNATKSMFDFINNFGMLLTLWISLAIEMSGILHSVYLVQYFFAWVTGKPVSTGESPRGILGELFFWFRVIMSSVVLGSACTITFVALINGQTDMYAGVPNTVTIIMVLFLTGLVGMMEAMQIALFAVVNLPEEELKHHPVCVTLCLFVLARMITIDVDMTPLSDGEPVPTVMGVSEAVQDFLNTGLPGALMCVFIWVDAKYSIAT